MIFYQGGRKLRDRVPQQERAGPRVRRTPQEGEDSSHLLSGQYDLFICITVLFTHTYKLIIRVFFTPELCMGGGGDFVRP